MARVACRRTAGIHADFVLIKAKCGDRWGNLGDRKTARNFGSTTSMAATVALASVHQVVALGELDPGAVVTPAAFVYRVVKIACACTTGGGFKAS